jgi:septal ring factor EnvC (AmiA/AmiB activator)
MRTTISSRFFMLMLAVLLALLMGVPSAFGADKTADNKELQRIKREMREKKKELKRADRKERSILSELEKIDRDIQTSRTEFADQQQQLRGSEKALREVEENNTALSRELAALKQQYSRRLRALYMMSRSGYATAIFSPAGPGQTTKRIKYLSLIAGRDQTVIREYGSTLRRLVSRQAEIEERKNELLAHQRAVETKKVELEARRHKKSILLGGVRQEKGLYEQSLHELEESSASLWAMIKQDEQKKRAAKAPPPASQQVRKTADHDKSRLPWPLEGPVLTRFGMQRHPQFGTMVYRRGIEIQAQEGESVRAVRDGQVAYADWYKGYGKLMILDHGNGFYTLYGNLSRIDLNRGAQAVRGQVIGLAGDTGSLKGSKLYFEIRRNGEAQDPLLWLAKK